jgi:hypothetical protein
MVSVSISSLVTSFITFWQNIAISIDFPDIGIPDWLRNCINFVKSLIFSLFSFFPSLPQFDLRFQMIIIGLGIPILLDVCAIWFFGSLFRTIVHIIDLVAIGGITYSFSSALIVGWSALDYVLVVVGGLWLFIHLIYYFTKDRTPSLSIETIKEISNSYMKGLIPDVVYSKTIDQINESIVSTKTDLVPKKKATWKDIIIFLLGIVVFIGALICNNTIDVGVKMPPAIKAFIPWIAIPLSIILMLVGFMGFFEKGRNAKFAIRKFFNRWGLRLLMLLFEILYIPILTLLISHLAPKAYSCPVGTHYFVAYNTSYYYDMFVTHNVTCQPCSMNSTYSDNNECEELCSGYTMKVLVDDNSLEFVRDVLKVNGGTILFVFIFILCGVPFLWNKVIRKNIALISAVYVFGNSSEEKWRNITSRIRSTGIFLFSEYKYKYAFWSVFIIFYKLVIMIISGLSKFINRDIQYTSSIIYLFMTIVTIKTRPSIYRLNNFFDVILYILNTAYSVVPILARYGIKTPDSVMIVLSFMLLFVPIVATVIFVCKAVIGSTSEDDPTMAKLTASDDDDDFDQVENENEKTEKKAKKSKKKKKKKYDPEDIYNFTYSSLMPLSECPKTHFFSNKLKVESVIPERTFAINKYKISKKMSKMYEVIDIVIDNSTIDFLSTVLKSIVVFAIAAFGWYIGALTSFYNEGNTNCSSI